MIANENDVEDFKTRSTGSNQQRSDNIGESESEVNSQVRINQPFFLPGIWTSNTNKQYPPSQSIPTSYPQSQRLQIPRHENVIEAIALLLPRTWPNPR
jgi:hypothetical protein